MTKWSRSFIGLITIFSVHLWSTEGQTRVFQNQLVSLGDNTAAVILHAKQMSYDYINGQPWSATRAREGTAAGLGVLFNTGADTSKWLQISSDFKTVNGRPITARDLANFDKALCMRNPQATLLTQRFKVDGQYAGNRMVFFEPNWFSSEAIDINVAYNIELFESHGGAATHAAVYVDQIIVNSYSPYPGPCVNPTRKDFATAADGQLEYIKRLQRYFRNQLGLPMSGNPYRMTQYQSRHLVAPFDLYYNERGDLLTNSASDFGIIPPAQVAVSLPGNGQYNNDYLQALKTAGIAMQQGSWFGWFARANPSQTGNSVQLLRALPNWDNLVRATGRSWNPTTLVYQTSNSYADSNVAYGRHPKTGKLFVVFQNSLGVLQLPSGKVVTDVRRVDNLFIETVDGRADLTISGSRISLKNTSNIGKGYVLTIR